MMGIYGKFILLSTLKCFLLKNLRQRPHPRGRDLQCGTQGRCQGGCSGREQRNGGGDAEGGATGGEDVVPRVGPAVSWTGHFHPNSPLLRLHFPGFTSRLFPRGAEGQNLLHWSLITRTLCPVESGKIPGCPAEGRPSPDSIGKEGRKL